MTRTIRRVMMLSAVGIAVLAPPGASAQSGGHDHPQPTWAVDVGVAGANIVVGALTSAVTAVIRGEDVSDAFLRGAVGGAVVFAGKRVAVERFDGAGLLGRQIASVGTGMVVDGGHGRAWLSEVWLPIGPASVQVGSQGRWRARIDLQTVGTLIWAATRSELDFDLGGSVSNGAPVFVARNHRIRSTSGGVNGVAARGVILLGVTNGVSLEPVQRHENVHVIQRDYFLGTFSRPIEVWAWQRFGGWSVPVDLDLLGRIPGGLFRNIREHEATALEIR